MARFFRKLSLSKDTRPGSLIFVGEKRTETVRIRMVRFSDTERDEIEVDSVIEALEKMQEDRMNWINIDGLHDPEIMAEIGRLFGVSNLILEDIMNTDQRPKYESDEDHMTIISKFLVYNRDQKRLETDQVSFIAGTNYLITFQERQGKHFEPVRERIRTTPVRKLIIHPDYLTYALLDSVVDNYMEIIGEIGNEIEQLEDEVLHSPGKDTVRNIYRYRSELNFLRKIILPHKEIAFDLLRTDSKMVRKETIDYIRDLQDHIVLSHEIIDAYLMLVTDQLSIYNANLSNKANEIMKTLTIFASIFIPLTFIAGIYGMNFKKIPELEWDHGYLYFWGLILLMGLGLLIFFKRKKWF